MLNTMDIQLQYLLWLQHLREVTHGIFDNFFLGVTWFGELMIPIAIISIIYWGINKRAGQIILFAYGLTLYVNVFLKMTACIKRPWLLEPSIKPIESALPAADGYSFPSGHTAGAVAVWGSIAFYWWKNRLIRYSMIAIILLVAFSRNYIGVHTPQDVIVSIIAGIFIILGANALLKITDKKANADIVFYTAAMILTFLLCAYLQIRCSCQMQSYNPLIDNVNPLAMKHSVYSKIAFLIGIFTGWIMEKRFINYKIPEGYSRKKAAGIIAGIAILYLLMKHLCTVLMLFTPAHIAYAWLALICALYVTLLYPIFLKYLFKG